MVAVTDSYSSVESYTYNENVWTMFTLVEDVVQMEDEGYIR